MADILQTLDQLFQAPAPHGSLFISPAVAARENVNLALSLHQFHLHLLAYLVPGLAQERLFQLGQSSTRGADQIMHRRFRRAHFRQHFFGRYPTVHHPGTPGLAVLSFDLGQKIL